MSSTSSTASPPPVYTYKMRESFLNSEESEGIWRDGPVITVNVLCNICESRNEIEYNTRAKYSE